MRISVIFLIYIFLRYANTYIVPIRKTVLSNGRRHHIAHFCENLDAGRECIKKCRALGRASFCSRQNICYCGQYLEKNSPPFPKTNQVQPKDFSDLYEHFFGPQYTITTTEPPTISKDDIYKPNDEVFRTADSENYENIEQPNNYYSNEKKEENKPHKSKYEYNDIYSKSHEIIISDLSENVLYKYGNRADDENKQEINQSYSKVFDSSLSNESKDVKSQDLQGLSLNFYSDESMFDTYESHSSEGFKDDRNDSEYISVDKDFSIYTNTDSEREKISIMHNGLENIVVNNNIPNLYDTLSESDEYHDIYKTSSNDNSEYNNLNSEAQSYLQDNLENYEKSNRHISNDNSDLNYDWVVEKDIDNESKEEPKSLDITKNHNKHIKKISNLQNYSKSENYNDENLDTSEGISKIYEDSSKDISESQNKSESNDINDSNKQEVSDLENQDQNSEEKSKSKENQTGIYDNISENENEFSTKYEISATESESQHEPKSIDESSKEESKSNDSENYDKGQSNAEDEQEDNDENNKTKFTQENENNGENTTQNSKSTDESTVNGNNSENATSV